MTNKEIVISTLREIGRNQAINYRERSISENHNGTQRIMNESLIPDFKIRNWTKEMVGCSVCDGGHVWTLLQPYDGNIYPNKPANMRAQWGLCHTTDPQKAKPFITPLGTSGIYMKGDCCLWNNRVYRSKIDNNVYSPGDYSAGWEEVK